MNLIIIRSNLNRNTKPRCPVEKFEKKKVYFSTQKKKMDSKGYPTNQLMINKKHFSLNHEIKNQ